MAAAAVPIIEALLPGVINLIASLVHKAAPIAEVNYGPKSGPVKRADVIAAVMDALQRSAAAGSIPKTLPADPVIALIVDAVIASMNLSGQLVPVAPVGASVAPGQAISIKAGQTLTISAV